MTGPKQEPAEVAAAATQRVPPWHSIPVKLISGIMLLTVVAGVSVWSIVARQQELLFFEQRTREASIQLEVVAKDFTERMLGGGGKAVWGVLTADTIELTRRNLAERIIVFRADGTIKSASDRNAIGTKLQVKGNPACPGCDSTRAEDFPATAVVSTGDTRVLRVVSQIRVGETCRLCHQKDEDIQSFVAADFDLSPLERARSERQRSILLIGIVSSAVLIVLVTLLFRRLVMRPIDALGNSMTRIAAGDLAARTPAEGRDELARLGRHFNRMAKRIEDQVASIAVAHTESELLYRLVLEASKSLETIEVAAAVVRVILEKLAPARVAFFLENAESGWTCASGGREIPPSTEQGTGALDAALAANTGAIKTKLENAPHALLAEALATRRPRLAHGANGLSMALPVVSETRLLGLLVCVGMPAGTSLDETQLENLGAHLMLAAANSRNYTGAITDALTGLKNKRYGLARLEEAESFAQRHDAPLGLLMCDIDHFKHVNDTYGHPVGDAVLREVSRRIAACVRKSDVAVRYGGEEFMLILPRTGADALAIVGEKIRARVAAEAVCPRPGMPSIAVTLSVGMAAYRGAGDSGDALIARADAALYRAKQGGRNRVELDA
ncbi:MAG: diguanylate cyclase [Proteobacteria bacterium]|nr:diguanylate cyclase [Pseudomonadota bacterium]